MDIEHINLHKQEYNFIKEYLKTFNNKHLFIYGSIGIGKTYILNKVLTELNYTIQYYDDNLEECKKICNTNNINNMFTNTTKKVLLIDPLDAITERAYLKTIKELLLNSKIPIIIVTNDLNDYDIKLFSEQKNIIKLHFNEPNFNDLLNMIMIYMKNRKIPIIKPKLESIIESSKYDIRYILNSINFYGKVIRSKTRKEYKDLHTRFSFFEAYKYLLTIDNNNDNNEFLYNDLYNIYSNDYDMLYLMTEQNYINNCYDIFDCENIINEIVYTESLDRTYFESNMYTYISFGTILKMRTMNLKNCNKLSFPEYLGNLSKKNSLNKLLNGVIKKNDLMKDIIIYHINNKNFNIAYDILKFYNITLDVFYEIIERTLINKEFKKNASFTKYYNKISK